MSSSTDHSPWVKKAVIATAVGVSAVGLYYLLTRKPKGQKTKEVSGADKLTVKDLKELGNKLFSSKKYEEAVDVFTKAILKQESDVDILKAMCFQNRAAAKERIGTFGFEDMLRDCEKALDHNPAYAKAYWRKARLEQQLHRYHDCIVDLFCACYMDTSFDKQAGQMLPLLLEELEKGYHEKWTKNHTPGQQKLVRHEKVYAWLKKTVVNCPLRKEVLAQKTSLKPETVYEKGLSEIANHHFEGIAEMMKSVEGEKRLEALLLAARFYNYQNQAQESSECLSLFDSLMSSLDANKAEEKKALIGSKHVIEIESSKNKKDIMQAYYEAISTDLRNVDFYAMTAFRLVLFGEAHEAMKILSTEGIDNNPNIKLLKFTLAILANTDGNVDMAQLHNSINQMEQFVNGLEPKNEYSQCLLAKIYATFGNEEGARELMDNVLKTEPNSINYFDRSCMAGSGAEAIEFLEKALKCELYHGEANLMCASLKLNEIGTELISKQLYEDLTVMLDRAESLFDGSIDFPVIQGVFRMREVLESKKEAAIKLQKYY